MQADLTRCVARPPLSILLKPRPMVQIGKHYVPKLRRSDVPYDLDAHPAK